MRRAHFLIAAKYSAGRFAPPTLVWLVSKRLAPTNEGNSSNVDLMKKVLFLSLLAITPALAQTQLTPKDAVRPSNKGAVAHVDNCAPIGRTANGELVYSMKCENLPAPPPPPQARMEEMTTPPPPPETEHSGGLFGWSYDRRPADQ